VVSEDSGLEVDALGGAPGVHSARFLGPDATYEARFAEILRRLRDVPEAGRTARFVCALVVARDGAIVFETRASSRAARLRRPAPADSATTRSSFSPELGCTLAEAGDVKASVSHRAQAVAALARWAGNLK
jgi:XTP/dITP diphosphohydrolase